MSAKPTVLVIGANGFIGGRVVETLHLTGDGHVRAGIRAWSGAARIARFPVEIVPCDVRDPNQIRTAMDGAVIVIHCALGDKEVIVQGTQNVLEAAERLAVQRIVHVSTAEVYGGATGQIDERCPLSYTGNPYADAKIDAEHWCWVFAARGLPVTVLRPSIVYGPFSNTWTVEICERLRSGRWGLLNALGEGICNLVYIDDLVCAIWLAANHRRAPAEAFNVNGPDLVTWNQYFQEVNAAAKLPPLSELPGWGIRLKTIAMTPVRVASNYLMNRWGAHIWALHRKVPLARRFLQSTRQYLRATPSQFELNTLYSRKAYYSPAKARQVLGYQPAIDLPTGLLITVAWLRHHGLLDD